MLVCEKACNCAYCAYCAFLLQGRLEAPLFRAWGALSGRGVYTKQHTSLDYPNDVVYPIQTVAFRYSYQKVTH